ncbi:MAG: cold shock domain-containing protein [Phycisphaerae bacterium]|nr:cold shock domain-containing protein [Phycisphaerae bacterium]
MSVGRVKWYDKTKGYGFIECPEGDVFFHFSDIQMDGFKALAEDQRVSYKLVRSSNGLKAKQILPLDNRASVRHAARYRTLIYMQITDGQEEDFDQFFSEIPAWFDAMEQDLGLRRIGTWRNGCEAVHLVESDRPYEQSIESAKSQTTWKSFQSWQEQLQGFLASDQTIMKPIQADAEAEAEESYESNPGENL